MNTLHIGVTSDTNTFQFELNGMLENFKILELCSDTVHNIMQKIKMQQFFNVKTGKQYQSLIMFQGVGIENNACNAQQT